MSTKLSVSASSADWYYCAIITDFLGETDYMDGYAMGDRPTLEDFREHYKCHHSYVAGMMYVDREDLEYVAQSRRVQCEKCDHVYGTPEQPLTILEWETAPTPHGAHHAEDREHADV